MNSNEGSEKPRQLSPDQERRIRNGVKMYEAYLKDGEAGIARRLEELKLERAEVQDLSSSDTTTET